jgi:hypothetical protein
LECYKRRLNIAVEQANHVNLEDLETCTEASEKLTGVYVDLQAQCAGKAAAEGSGNAWQQEFAAWTVGVRPAKERLTAAIKQLEAKQRKNMYQAASQALDRALAAADDVLGDNDPDEIEEVRQQLSTKVREMEAAAAYLNNNPLLQDGQKLQAAERSLRKLGRRRRSYCRPMWEAVRHSECGRGGGRRRRSRRCRRRWYRCQRLWQRLVQHRLVQP